MAEEEYEFDEGDMCEIPDLADTSDFDNQFQELDVGKSTNTPKITPILVRFAKTCSELHPPHTNTVLRKHRLSRHLQINIHHQRRLTEAALIPLRLRPPNQADSFLRNLQPQALQPIVASEEVETSALDATKRSTSRRPGRGQTT